MIRITQQRAKYIGCNYCVEAAPHRWRMSKKDGLLTLIGATEKSGFHRIVVGDGVYEESFVAANICPVEK